MNRNKRGKMPEISRKMYKDVKKYDRQQFTAFCSEKDKNIVLNAWNDERMIVDKTFEKAKFNEKKLDIEKLRKDIKEHLSPYASKGYVDCGKESKRRNWPPLAETK